MFNGGVNADSNIIGKVKTDYCTDVAYKYLTDTFSDFTIMMTKGLCADIKDETAKSVILAKWGEGDGKHVLVSKLEEVTSLYWIFREKPVRDISWLSYFKNVTNTSQTFALCANLVDVDSGGWNASNVINNDSMFNGCHSLRSVRDFESWKIKAIGNNMFWFCNSLELSALPDTVTSIGTQAFRNCSSITLTTLPSSVTSIGAAAFRFCTKCSWESTALQHVTNIDGATSNYGGGAFQGNVFKDRWIVLGEGLTHIGVQTFNGATIDKIKLLATTPPTLDDKYTEPYNSFKNDAGKYVQIYVPDSSLDKYKTATNWEDFAANWNNIHPMSEWTD